MGYFELGHDKDGFENQTPRYKRIDDLNRESFLMVEGTELQVLQSIHSVGGRRDALTEKHAKDFDDDVVRKAKGIGRRILTGNISTTNGNGPYYMNIEARKEDAKANLYSFMEQHGIDPARIRFLKPNLDFSIPADAEPGYQVPLVPVNVDEEELFVNDRDVLQPKKAGDFMYTYDPEVVLAAPPADCPLAIIEAQTPKGKVTILLHLPWQGVANGYVDQAKVLMDDLEVDWESVRVQITAGGHAETFDFQNFTKYDPRTQFPGSEGHLFVDVEEVKVQTKDGEVDGYNFRIDLPAESYEQIEEKWPVTPYQIFANTSDSTSPTSGHSSHSRAFKGYGVDGNNSRDLVAAVRW